VEQVLQRHPVGPVPCQLALAVADPDPHAQLDLMVDQPAQHRIERAQLHELTEDQAHHGLHLLVGIQHDRTRGCPHIPDRQRHGQLPPAGFGPLAGEHALLEQVQLCLAHRPFEAQQQPVVVVDRIVDPVAVGQQRAEQRAQLQQPMPVRTRAGQPRHLHTQDDAHVVQADLADQPPKARTARGACA
jgi:hypothetical protein